MHSALSTTKLAPVPVAKRVSQVDILVGEEEAENLAQSVERRWLTDGPNADDDARRVCRTIAAFFEKQD